MLIIEHSVETTAAPEAIWALYEDCATWPRWDEGIESVHLEGPFAVGTRGKLKPSGGPEVTFQIVLCEPCQYFSDVSFLPLTKLLFTHWLTQEGNKVTITHRVEMHGLLSFVFAFIIGRKIKAGLPTAMKRLAEFAERKVNVVAN